MRATLSIISLGLLLPASVIGAVAPRSDSNALTQRDPLATTGDIVESLDTRSAQPSQDEILSKLSVRDHDDDDDDDDDHDDDHDDDDDGIIDDIKDGADSVGDDIKDGVDNVGDKIDEGVDDVFDDGVANVKPGMITVGLLSTVAAALAIM